MFSSRWWFRNPGLFCISAIFITWFPCCFICLYNMKKKKKDEGYPKRVNGPGLRTLHVTFSHIPLNRTQLQGYNIQAVLGNTTELWAWERIGIGLYSYLMYSTVIFISIFKKLIPLLDLAVIYWFSILLLIVIARSFVTFFLILLFIFIHLSISWKRYLMYCFQAFFYSI